MGISSLIISLHLGVLISSGGTGGDEAPHRPGLLLAPGRSGGWVVGGHSKSPSRGGSRPPSTSGATPTGTHLFVGHPVAGRHHRQHLLRQATLAAVRAVGGRGCRRRGAGTGRRRRCCGGAVRLAGTAIGGAAVAADAACRLLACRQRACTQGAPQGRGAGRLYTPVPQRPPGCRLRAAMQNNPQPAPGCTPAMPLILGLIRACRAGI